MAPTLRSGDVIQDDARQHVFWMLRFRDPELFRDDLIADYFQSLAPAGYTALYWTLSPIVDPLMASKLLPWGLGFGLALFTFLLVRRLHPSLVTAFLSAVLVSWYAWQHDDLASASPRAFLLPLLVALLWALAAGRVVLGVVLTGLAALFYPVGGALGVALLGVRLARLAPPIEWGFARRRLGPRLAPAPRSAWLAFGAAAVLVSLILLPEQLASSPFGPTVSADEARVMPEFGPSGRNAFFVEGAYRYWLQSYRSGLNLRVEDPLFPGVPIFFEYAALAALLPLLLLFRPRLPAARALSGRAAILLQLLVASFALFFLAHLLLFRLYLPARYVQWSVPLVLGLAAGLALGIVVEETAARLASRRRNVIATGLALGLAGGLVLYPASYNGLFVRDAHPSITAYLRAQPRDVLVAGVPTEADSVPTWTGRRVLATREYALAYHAGYYDELRARLEDLIDAYYAEAPERVVVFADGYGVDLVLVNRAAFDPAQVSRAWAGEFEPFVSRAAEQLRGRRRFALLQSLRRCAVADDGQVAVVPVACLRGES